MLKTNVVVTASVHNPSVLHPEFLKSQGIVTGVDLVEPPICTPAFASVKYKNGLAFAVTAGRMDITDTKLESDFTSSEAPSVAIKYIQVLPHVRYTGVGINFTGLIECPAPGEFLINKFLKPGDWNSDTLKVKDLNLKLSYDVPGAVFGFTCLVAKVSHPSFGDKYGIVVEGNYHTDLSKEAVPVEASEQAINLYRERHTHFLDSTKRIMGLES